MSDPRPLRISIIQGAFLPVPPRLGGAVEKQWYTLGREFARRGHQVTHISRMYGEDQIDEWVEGVRYLRVRGFATPSSLIRLKLEDLFYSARVLKVLPHSDIVVTNTFWAPVLLRWWKRGRIYVDFARMPKGQVAFYLRSDRLRVPSQAVAAAIEKSCPSARSLLRVIPNLIAFSSDAPALAAKKKVILYAGRIHREKGLELLLGAFSALVKDPACADWRLDLVGPVRVAEGGGGEPYLAELQARYSHPAIRWHPPIYGERELSEFYDQAAIFCYPSVAEYGETFGVAPLEAMACGAVPVISALDCFRDFIRDGENGLVFNHRAEGACEELSGLLRKLVCDSALRGRLAQNAFGVRQSHEAAQIASLFLEDFEALCAPGGASNGRP